MSRSARRRGNTMLELALVIVPWMASICGIIDFSFAVFVRNALQHAVREGVRYAVTYQLVDGMGHDASIKNKVQGNAMGFLSSVDDVLDPVIYTIGLGDPTDPSSLDEMLRRRVANDPTSPIYDENRQPVIYVYAADNTQLSMAFYRIASEVLRIAR